MIVKGMLSDVVHAVAVFRWARIH